MDVSDALRTALADTWSFYFQAHAFHWNVEGPLFHELHGFFGDIYDDSHDAVDGLAEQLRALGELAPTSPAAIESASGIRFSDAVPDAKGMVAGLANSNEIVLGSLKAACSAASEAGEIGLANYLQDRANVHKKWGWMLDASLADQPGADVIARARSSKLYGRKVAHG